jgi:hypothetical protein
MLWTTTIFGLLLLALGAGGYFGIAPELKTIVPGVCGIALLSMALVAAVKGSLRKHAMHAATLVALVGLLVNAFGTADLIRRVFAEPLQVIQFVAALLCATFLGMSIKSFIDARRRKTGEQFRFSPDPERHE